jgi:hypothetical protein
MMTLRNLRCHGLAQLRFGTVEQYELLNSLMVFLGSAV